MDEIDNIYQAVPELQKIGTLEQFRQAIQTPEGRRAIFDNVPALQSVGSYEQFDEAVSIKNTPGIETVGQPTVSNKPVFGPTISQGPALQNETTVDINRKPTEVDHTIEAFGNAFERGLAQADLANIGIDAINIQNGQFTDEQIEKIIEANKRIERVPISGETTGIIAAVNAGEYKKAFNLWTTNPFKITGELFTQSLVSMVKSGARTVIESMAGGAAAGALRGGATGAVAGPAGALPGALLGGATGAAYGAFAGMGVAEYQLEAGTNYIDSITEAMSESGLDPNKPDDWKKMFQDVETLKSARDKAINRGLAVSIVDLTLGRLAGVIAGVGKNTARVLAGAGVEFAGEPIGEFAGQKAAGEEFNPGELVAEGLGGGGGPIYTTGHVIAARFRAQEAINNKITNKKDKTPLAAAVVEDQEDNIRAEINLSEQVKEITPTQAKELNEELDRLSELKETLPEDLAPEQKRDILTLIDQRNELEQKPLDPAFEERRRLEIEKINEQIRKVANENPKPEKRQNELVQTPPIKEAIAEAKSPEGLKQVAPLKTDFDDTLYNPRTKKLTKLGEEVKKQIAEKEDVTILSAREDTPENRKFIADKLGIHPDQIKLGLSPEQKAANLKEGDVFYDNDAANTAAARRVPGVEIRNVHEESKPYVTTLRSKKGNPLAKSTFEQQTTKEGKPFVSRKLNSKNSSVLEDNVQTKGEADVISKKRSDGNSTYTVVPKDMGKVLREEVQEEEAQKVAEKYGYENPEALKQDVKSAINNNDNVENDVVLDFRPETVEQFTPPVPETASQTVGQPTVSEETTEGEPTPTTPEDRQKATTFIKRILSNDKVAPETKANIETLVDPNKTEERIDNKEAEKIANAIVEEGGLTEEGLTQTFEALKNSDPKIWKARGNVGLMVGNKLAYNFEKLGLYDKAAEVDVFVSREGYNFGQALSRLQEEATAQTRLEAFARNNRLTVEAHKQRKVAGKTVKDKISNINKELQPSSETIDKALNEIKELQNEIEDRIKRGKELKKQGLKDLRNSGLGAGIPLSKEAIEALTKIIKGLYLEFSGNVQKIREGFHKQLKKELKNAPVETEELWNSMIENGVLDKIRIEQGKAIKQIIQDHIDNPQSGKTFKDALKKEGVPAPLANRIEKALREKIKEELNKKGGTIGEELNGGKSMSKPRQRDKKLQDLIDAAANGLLSDRDTTRILSDTFGLGDISLEQQEKLNTLLDKLNNSNSKRQELAAETAILTELDKLSTKQSKQISDFIMATYYTSILSGLSTQSTAFWGALYNVLGELGTEVIRGTVEGRLLDTIKAFGKGFSRQGYGAGVDIVGDILRKGTIDLSFADVPTKSLTPLDRLINTPPSFNKLSDVFSTPFRTFMYLPTKMYRLLIAADAILKSGLTETFAHIGAYNKVLADGEFTKGSPEFYDKINKILGESNVEYLKEQVDAELAEGKIEEKERNTRLRELIEAGRDKELQQDANERALETILMNTKVSGAIPSAMTALFGGAMHIKEDDPILFKLGKMTVKTFFPIVRVPANQISRAYQFTPVNLIQTEVLSRLPGKVGEYARRRVQYNIATGETIKSEITPEERKRQLYRAVLGSAVMGILGGILLAKGEDDDKEPIIRITGGGTGDWKTDMQVYGKEFKPYTIQLNMKKLGLPSREGTNYSTGIKYGDTPLMMALSPFGFIMDKRALGETDKTKEITNLISAGMQGAWDGSFDLSIIFLQEAMKDFGNAITLAKEEDNNLDGLGKIIKIAGGAKVTNYKEYSVAKQVYRRASPFIYPNLYKQSTQLWKDLKDKPIERTNSTLEMLMKDVPFAERFVNKAITDKFGYPIQPDFDTPFIPDALENWVDKRIGPGESIGPEWEALKDKNFTLPRDYNGSSIEGITPEIRDQLQSVYQQAFRELFRDNIDEIKSLNGEELNNFINEEVHSPARVEAQEEILGTTRNLKEAVEELKNE